MHLSEVKTFLSEVLKRMGNDAEVKEVTEVHTEQEYWGVLHAFNVTSAEGCEWHISCRLRQKPLPSNCVDFLDIAYDDIAYDNENRQSHRHLIVIYLNSEEDSVCNLDPKYIPSKQWQSVCHLDWAMDHPFKTNTDTSRAKVSNVILKGTSQILREGGIRKDKVLTAPLISIITIVLNGDEYLEQTIQSLIHQKDPDVEYIIVDGGSTDDSLKIINRYAAYIDYWISEADEGLYDALNRGINLCRGKFVGAIHANDFYSSCTITELKKAITKKPNTSFFYGNLWYLDTDKFWLRGREITSTFQMVMFGDFFHPTNFINRQDYINKGTYNLDYHIAADYDLGIRFWKAGLDFQYLPKALAYFRLGGLSGNLYRNQWQRHQIRVANGEIHLYSLSIMIMVLGNYYLKFLTKKCMKFFSRGDSRG